MKTNSTSFTQYTLVAVLILTAALATTAFGPGPVSGVNCPAAPTTHCTVSVQDFHVKETGELQRAFRTSAARWSAAQAYHTKESLDQQRYLKDAEAARWLTTVDFHLKEAADSARWLTTVDFHLKEAADAAHWDAAKVFHTKETSDAAKVLSYARFPNDGRH
jgi:hypothetical protein